MPCRLLILLVAMAVVFSTGCGRSEPEPEAEAEAQVEHPQATPTPAPTPTPVPYTGPEAGAVIEPAEGVRIEVLAPGRGGVPLAEGARVAVRYTLFDDEGNAVESSDDFGGAIFIDSLGDAHVFPGLDRALLEFYPGMRGRVTFPAIAETGEQAPATIEIEVIEEQSTIEEQ